ncbi:MAG: hypothetical protein ACLFU0_10370 [Alphaproteobacteria bacterium]
MSRPAKAGGGWAFRAGMRRGGYGWRGSAKAAQRLKAATAEIKAVAKTDPVRAGEGVVVLAERIWPAFEMIDTSTGALGGAVNRTLASLIPILIAAPADAATRARWLERLIDAIQEDGVDYLSPLADRFGEIAVYPSLVNHWADQLVDHVRTAWRAPGFAHAALAPVCLSCLLEAGRYDELDALLALRRPRLWHDQRFAAEALLRRGRPEDALAFAEALLAENARIGGDGRIARFCEDVLRRLGRDEEAYRRFALPRAAATTYLATWRELARRYPERPGRDVLEDLIATHGRKGKWFAAARAAGCLDLARACAADPEAEPKTLIRAARDHVADDPRFAADVATAALGHLLAGRGYETGPGDAAEAVRHLLAAARRLGEEARARAAVEALIERAGPGGRPLIPALRAALAAERGA